MHVGSERGQVNGGPREVAAVTIPTPFGEFETRAFECPSGQVYLAMLRGDVTGPEPVLIRPHSECLTGDVLGSLRCDCGVQLRAAMRAIAAEGRGVLLYLTGQEGRGIGLVNKLRAYVEQDRGADTLDANLRLGFAADSRDYADAARVLRRLGVRSVRLLSNNPHKATGLRAAGVHISAVQPLPTVAHARNHTYLQTKQHRFGHRQPAGPQLPEPVGGPVDVAALLGAVRPRADRPYVVVKYAQTLDGRIATTTGDSRWISGEGERRVSHALRSACDAVLVGTGTVLTDDPRLTVRMVPGASPLRVVLDSTLRTPDAANVLSEEAATLLVTTPKADLIRRAALAVRGVAVRVVDGEDGAVSLPAALAVLRAEGVASLLVEGGRQVITSMLRAGLVDRLVVAIAPKIIGTGVEAVGPLGVDRVAHGIPLRNRVVRIVEEDVLLAWDIATPRPSP